MLDDKINPSHYGGDIQPIEFMQSQMADIEFRGFLKGNIIKYVARAGKKENTSAVEDLLKAKRYIEWLIMSFEGNVINPRN